MDRSPALIVESIAQAKATIDLLHDRAASSDNIADRADLSVLKTTVRRIEELLDIAAEYEDSLLAQLARTNYRLNLVLG